MRNTKRSISDQSYNKLRPRCIKICIDALFECELTVSGLNKQKMFKLISLTVKESIKLFYNNYWIQTDGVTMSSLLGITLTNVFLYYHESDFLKICAKDFSPVYYSRYVDNIFVFFNKPEHAQFFF